ILVGIIFRGKIGIRYQFNIPIGLVPEGIGIEPGLIVIPIVLRLGTFGCIYKHYIISKGILEPSISMGAFFLQGRFGHHIPLPVPFLKKSISLRWDFDLLSV